MSLSLWLFSVLFWLFAVVLRLLRLLWLLWLLILVVLVVLLEMVRDCLVDEKAVLDAVTEVKLSSAPGIGVPSFCLQMCVGQSLLWQDLEQ